MEELTMLEIKKNLYKSKTMAEFSHYQSGELFYNVAMVYPDVKEAVFYQFPISVFDEIKLDDIPLKTMGESIEQVDIEIKNEWNDVEPLYVYDNIEEKYVAAISKGLSTDLGITPFDSKIRGSELIRWITMAYNEDKFIRIS